MIVAYEDFDLSTIFENFKSNIGNSGLISESGSLWLKSTKKCTKQYPEQYPPKEKMLIVLAHFCRFEAQWKRFWGETTFKTLNNLMPLSGGRFSDKHFYSSNIFIEAAFLIFDETWIKRNMLKLYISLALTWIGWFEYNTWKPHY